MGKLHTEPQVDGNYVAMQTVARLSTCDSIAVTDGHRGSDFNSITYDL